MKAELKVTLLTGTPQAEEIIATAAKLCYSELGIEDIREGLSEEEIEKFLDILMRMGHASPIEHASFTFGIEGVSRSLTHQLVRHRIASYSQKSQRYVLEDQFEFVIPPSIDNNRVAKALYLEHMDNTQDTYDMLIGTLMLDKIEDYKGVVTEKVKSQLEKEAMEDARYVLPNACETKIISTMNVRQLLNFFNTRCCNRAQWEIRELATQMLIQMQEVAPIIFKNAGPSCVTKPCPEGNMSCGKIRAVRKKFKR